MSQITNRLGLPQAYVDAVKNDDYSRGDSDFTVTELIGPPRLGALRAKHSEEIVEDASDRVWNLVGKIGHGILEKANRKDLVETRLYATVLGKKVGGQFDSYLLEDATLSDWKFTTVWKFKDNVVPTEYVQQLNMLAFILGENGIKVNNLRVVPTFRDWSKPEARRDPKYPQTAVLNLEVPYWERTQTLAYIEERVRLHQSAREQLASGVEPPLCTEEERWVRPTKYAIKKKDAKRATKLFDTLGEATAALGTGMIVEVREGENTRCALYCPVANKCSFGRAVLAENSLEGIFQ